MPSRSAPLAFTCPSIPLVFAPARRGSGCINRAAVAVIAVMLLATPTLLDAGVQRIEILERRPHADGRAFAGIGPYEVLLGRVFFAVDPAAEANQAVVDLELAPRDAGGMVEFAADLEIITPVDQTRTSGTLLYDVNNRGGRTAAYMFHENAEQADFLMRHGHIVVASGWIAELLPSSGPRATRRLRLAAPVARDRHGPVTGRVRAEVVPNAPAARLNISNRDSMGSYTPVAEALVSATLTWRLHQGDPRISIPRSQWHLEVTPVEVAGEWSTLPRVELVVTGGLRPGYIYELIYEAQGAVVQGLGLAGIRDLVSFLRYDRTEENPLRRTDGRSPVRRTIGFGVSQSGRLLRMMIHDGFNTDEKSRQVFDGLIPHVAGSGLGFFNHRFASPTRHSTEHDEHAYPTDLFPFSYETQVDPVSGRRGGLLERARAKGHVPKIMHIQTAGEYWHRSGSLTHTDPRGERDAVQPPEVRFYALGGARHGPGDGRPRPASTGQLPQNPTDYRPFLRALLLAMEAWIRDGVEPPPSVYPRIADGTLVGWREAESGWSALPAVRYPEAIQEPSWYDYGPDFEARRVITRHPPEARELYRVLVPRHGPDNNGQGMLQAPTAKVPVATFTGWNLRAPRLGAPQALLRVAGGYIPFPRTAEERRTTGDPRPSLEEKYGTFERYFSQFEAAVRELVGQRYLLEEDLNFWLQLAREHRVLFSESGYR